MVFAEYVKLYYDYAISSVYFADTETPGFNSSWLVKKELQDVMNIKYGNWDGIHVVTCTIADNKCNYRVCSTVMITQESTYDAIGKMSIAGSCAKTTEQSVACNAEFNSNPDLFHIKNIGRIIEKNEQSLRQEVTSTYIDKQREIIDSERHPTGYQSDELRAKFKEEMFAAQAQIAAKREAAQQ